MERRKKQVGEKMEKEKENRKGKKIKSRYFTFFFFCYNLSHKVFFLIKLKYYNN